MAGARFVAQRGVLKPFIWHKTDVTVLGTERLDDLRGPYVAVSNHSSHLDAPLIIGALPRRLSRYVAAGAAADYFFDVWWRKGLTALFFNAFPVDRSGLRVGVAWPPACSTTGCRCCCSPRAPVRAAARWATSSPAPPPSASAGTSPACPSRSTGRPRRCRTAGPGRARASPPST